MDSSDRKGLCSEEGCFKFEEAVLRRSSKNAQRGRRCWRPHVSCLQGFWLLLTQLLRGSPGADSVVGFQQSRSNLSCFRPRLVSVGVSLVDVRLEKVSSAGSQNNHFTQGRCALTRSLLRAHKAGIASKMPSSYTLVGCMHTGNSFSGGESTTASGNRLHDMHMSCSCS